MKFIYLIVLCLILAQKSFAGGCAINTRCLTLEKLIQAATPEEADRLRNELANLGTKEVLKNCSPEERESVSVTKISGKICSTNTVQGNICKFEGAIKCVYKDRLFNMNVSGVCHGGLHDCGTFNACATDESMEFASTSFRGDADPVPKTVNLQGQGGRQ